MRHISKTLNKLLPTEDRIPIFRMAALEMAFTTTKHDNHMKADQEELEKMMLRSAQGTEADQELMGVGITNHRMDNFEHVKSVEKD